MLNLGPPLPSFPLGEASSKSRKWLRT
ncbi:protein of unknown function [Denitratisoma oestradiolicum]|uniref:Uncharacterized protein n=1 Tax=Denitratisoma oestradiolicum TaxID=311182 RepID=A0A6S6XNL7_9PROT|nr:protein of unknown function [Denitratisoma oestradiolicum]